MLKKIFAFLIFLTLCAPAAFASSSTSEECPANTQSASIARTLRITALYPNPNSGETEWIELSNTGAASVDLSNYTLEDSTAKPWTPSGTLKAGELIQLSGFSFQLNNGNETVTLKTASGVQIDTWTYTTSSKGEVLERDGTAASDTETVTDASNESTPSSTPTRWPSFSEALPNPEGSDSTEEWIELYNSFDESLNLEGLKLDDAEGGSTPYPLTGTLPAESYLLLSVQDSRLNLNNTEDHLRLLGVDGEILWDYPYSDPDEGNSLIAYGASTTWTTVPTPGEENVQSSPNEDEVESDEENSDEGSNYQDGDLSEEVAVTEVFPNPEGPDNEEEWIELTNGGSSDVNLGNWTLSDASGKSYTFPDTTVIKAGETLVLYRTESSISLNNSNESVTLADPTGEVLSEVSFESSQEEQSYSEIQIEEVSSLQASSLELGNPMLTIWQWVTPSPGLQNPIWKQIKGSVTEFDGSLLTLFDGVSTWTFLTHPNNSEDLLYEEGNVLLVQATLKDQLYEIMHAELLEAAAKNTSSSVFPWSTALSLTALTSWGAYEVYKHRKTILNFSHQALK